MRTVVLPAFMLYSKKHEGFTPFPYCDTLNLVTTGIGNLIDRGPRNSFDTSAAAMAPAMNLPWKRRAAGWTSSNPLAGERVSANDIMNAWVTCKLKEQESPGFNQRGGFAYASLTNITLDLAGIDELVSGKIASEEKELRLLYPNYDAAPGDAQFGLMSMTWAMGSHFFPVLRPDMNSPVGAGNIPFFTAFHDAFVKGDFATAALRSEFKGGGNVLTPGTRNFDNRIAFNNAAAVVKVGANPDSLFFPGTVPSSTGGIASLVSNPGIAKGTGAVLAGGLIGWGLFEWWKDRKS